jgi:hypothetical protein
MGVEGKVVIASGPGHKGTQAFFLCKNTSAEGYERSRQFESCYRFREISSFIISFVPP